MHTHADMCPKTFMAEPATLSCGLMWLMQWEGHEAVAQAELSAGRIRQAQRAVRDGALSMDKTFTLMED